MKTIHFINLITNLTFDFVPTTCQLVTIVIQSSTDTYLVGTWYISYIFYHWIRFEKSHKQARVVLYRSWTLSNLSIQYYKLRLPMYFLSSRQQIYSLRPCIYFNPWGSRNLHLLVVGMYVTAVSRSSSWIDKCICTLYMYINIKYECVCIWLNSMAENLFLYF